MASGSNKKTTTDTPDDSYKIADDRLQVVRLLCKQKGINWTGLTIEEHDMMLDLAGAAVRGRNKLFEPKEVLDKTQGEKSRQDLLDDAKASGANAWAHGAAHDPKTYGGDLETQQAWSQGWVGSENEKRRRRGEPHMFMPVFSEPAPAKVKPVLAKTQGEKTRKEHLKDAENYGRDAYAGGKPLDPKSYDPTNQDPEAQQAWSHGWIGAEYKDRVSRDETPMMTGGFITITMPHEAPAKAKSTKKPKAPAL